MSFFGKIFKKDGEGEEAQQSRKIDDYCKAVEFFGDAHAQYILGLMYEQGHDGNRPIPKDYIVAAQWYRRAADQGYALGQYAIANMYRLGSGVPQDLAQAMMWFHKAADQGYVNAQYNLGIMYGGGGKGITQNAVEAMAWLRKAAIQGHAQAHTVIAMMYQRGEGVPQDLTQAMTWYRKAADLGDAQAQYNLGTMFASGVGVTPDYAQAVHWFHRAADQGDELAQYSLGIMLMRGQGVQQDYLQAMMWFFIAKEKGEASSIKILREIEAQAPDAPLGEAKKMARSWLSTHDNNPNEPSNDLKNGLLDRAMESSHKIIIAGYRELARQTNLAPTSKTSDNEIVYLYQKVLSAFHLASLERNERMPAGVKNAIVFYFLQIKEKHPSEFFEEHLQYELQWYSQNGLRDTYRKEINLIKILGLEDDGDSIAAGNYATEPEKIIVECPWCTQKLRIPSGRRLRVTCSKCRTEFEAGG